MEEGRYSEQLQDKEFFLSLNTNATILPLKAMWTLQLYGICKRGDVPLLCMQPKPYPTIIHLFNMGKHCEKGVQRPYGCRLLDSRL